MNIEFVKRLRNETKMKIKDCVSALESANWDYDIVLKLLYRFEPMTGAEYKPIDRSPVMELDEVTGKIEIAFYDTEGKLLYRKGNILEGTWKETEILVDKPCVQNREVI